MPRTTHRIARPVAYTLALTLGAGLSLSMAQAATVTWTGAAGNGLWFDAGNWSGGAGVPGNADDAVFGVAATGSISLAGGSAAVQSLSLQAADALNFANGSVATGTFAQTGGTNTLQVDLTATDVSLGSEAHLRVDAGASVIAQNLAGLGLPNQARLSVLGGASVSSPALNLVGVRVDVDGSDSQLRFTTGEAQALAEIYLTNGGVLGCLGSSALLDALAGASVSISIGNLGPPGRLDCAGFAFNQGVNATARIELSHNQNGYRLERPDGSPISLSGSMRLITSNAVHSVLPGNHGYTGPTLIGGSATLELQGELTGSDVTVQAGSTLRGDGRVHGDVAVAAGAAIRPGTNADTEPGTLRMGSLALVDLAFLGFDMAEPGTAGGVNDLLVIDGAASLAGGRVDIAALGDFGRYRLITINGPPSGSLVLESLPAGQDLGDWQIGNDIPGQIDLVPRGVLQLDPPSLALETAEGSTVDGTVTLRNVGGTEINVTTVFPPDDPRFSRIGGSCGTSGFQIAPEAECTVSYRFSPDEPGQVSTFVLLNTDAVAGASSITLEGTATRLPPELGPAVLDFGTVAVDETSAVQQATLVNPSALPLAIAAIGLDQGLEFSIAQNACGSSLASAASCTIDLVFEPLANGVASDALQVDSEAGPLSIDLQGEGFSTLIFADGFEQP